MIVLELVLRAFLTVLDVVSVFEPDLNLTIKTVEPKEELAVVKK